jgi:ParB family chromosome partitioning protein
VAVEKARVDSGRVKPGKPKKKSAAHLAFTHPLARNAKARCQRLGHKKGGSASVGGIACGECWESVIRADEREHLNQVSNERGRCVLCDVVHDPDANPLSA